VGEEEGETMSERSCWIIITVVIGVWTQRDLWTDVEDTISRLGA